MHSRARLLFPLVFAVVTLLEIIGDVTHREWLHYSCKPLIIGLLLLYVWQSYQSVVYPQPVRWLFVGMFFALAGDVFLMIQEIDLFAPGLGAFLAMQVCYSVAFVKSIRLSGHKIVRKSLWLKALPFLLYVISFLAVLRPVFAQDPALSVIWWPLVLYAICLGAMGTLSTQRPQLPSYGQVVLGALLFIFSDSVIAIDKFLLPIPGAPWLIMTTYAAAQYLIVTGMTQVSLTQQESGLSTG
ncbi:lysoplasmalogenase [Spirosoma validum]|uniref:Lysoplasmalogenase n=1 Tax=Spirosoma validum TaxID=2771355 RepID=A0A927B191_9BACT|nr:lysoplasmalogenase [Spirosoma validum]MBD2753483.1 lysoplasmalogenase [Spirosoma validum]